jgi:hypothetical protein
MCSCKEGSQKRSEAPKRRGHHNAPSNDAEADILAWIQYQAQKSRSPAKTDIHHHCEGEFGKAITHVCEFIPNPA